MSPPAQTNTITPSTQLPEEYQLFSIQQAGTDSHTRSHLRLQSANCSKPIVRMSVMGITATDDVVGPAVTEVAALSVHFARIPIQYSVRSACSLSIAPEQCRRTRPGFALVHYLIATDRLLQFTNMLI